MQLVKQKSSPAGTSRRINSGSLVEYEIHGAPLLAAVLSEKKDKFLCLNSKGGQLELPAARLHLLPRELPADLSSNEQRLKFLRELEERSQAISKEIDLEALWLILSEEPETQGTETICELNFGNQKIENYIALRMALLADKVFFKRQKLGFEPRTAEVVESLKVQQQVEQERLNQRQTLLQAIQDKLRGLATTLPQSINNLRYFASGISNEKESEFAQAILEEVLKQNNLNFSGKAAEKIFQLLVKLGVFTEDENLHLIRFKRSAEFSAGILAETQSLVSAELNLSKTHREASELFCFTIDSAETRDCDDALSVERLPAGYRFGIHIADVASQIHSETALFQEALERATSVYLPDKMLPMFPPQLSEGLLSLLPRVKRPSLSALIETDKEFRILSKKLEPLQIQITAKLSYELADSLLCADDSAEQNAAAALELEPKQVSSLSKDLSTLWEFASAREEERISRGANQYTREDKAVRILPDGRLELVDAQEDTPSHKVVGEMMVLANELMAEWGRSKQLALAYRSQEPPEVDPALQGLEIPSGPARDFFQRSFSKRSLVSVSALPHYGLGLPCYIQATSPIRRVVDLVNQRQLLASLGREGAELPLLSPEELESFLQQVEPSLDEANFLQRDRKRYYLLKYLAQEQIKELLGTILKVDTPKPLVELDLLKMIAPVTLNGKGQGLENLRKRLGEQVKFEVVNVDPRADSLVLREKS